MDSCIQIIEKPDWVSWDDIHDVVWLAHAQNREKGIVMRNPSLQGEEIRQRIEGKGKMYVALDGNKLVGTAACSIKKIPLWCGKGCYGYYCFAALLPSYRKMGIYPRLCEIREEELVKQGIYRVLMDTHEGNKREMYLARKQGFIPVDFVARKDHYSVMMVKWLDGCPYSRFWCSLIYHFRRMVVKILSLRHIHNK
jgi:GNAT superfamily N-acetyltransferase